MALALWLWTISAVAQTTPLPASRHANRILPLDVVVNGARSGTWVFVERAGVLYAPRDAFEEWRIQLEPNVQPIQFKGLDYLSLASVPGYKGTLDFANQSLEVTFAPAAFAETRFVMKPAGKLAVSPAEPTLFLNYDVGYQRTVSSGAPAQQNAVVVGEFGFSSNLGVLTGSMLGQYATSNAAAGGPRRLLRLETTMTKDLPDQNKTFRLGDASTRMSLLGQSVYFGGIQFGTNYALTPGFVTQPMPILKGVSMAPSTVELYINDVLRQTSQTPAGPFAIDTLPGLTGGGEARMVVRDLLGRETAITRSFFTNNRLLATGLDDWSIEAGKLRRDLGVANGNYGPAFARGFWRHGYSDTLTLEAVVESSGNLGKLEAGVVTPVAGQWLASAALAGSRERTLGAGRQWMLGLERQGQYGSIFLQAQGASATFRSLGQDVDTPPAKGQLAANWSYDTRSLGSFGLGFASARQFDGSRVDTMSANYSIQILQQASLSLSASRSRGDFSGSFVGMTLMLPIDKSRVLSASVSSAGRQTDHHLTDTRNPTEEDGMGWRLLKGRQQNLSREEAGLYYLGRYGQLNGDVSASPGQSAQRLSASGGLVLTDGHLFATRRSNQSLALVEVPGYGDVGVGLAGHMTTRTNPEGVALVSQLVPYQSNAVRLAPQDLPVSAELDSIEQVTVPAWRSVVRVTFPARSGRGALLRIALDTGEVAPAGAIVQIEGDNRDFYVARRGEAYVTGLQPANRLRLKWKNHQCEFDVALPAGTRDEIPRLGPLLCKGGMQ